MMKPQQPLVQGLSRITSNLYISSVLAANNKFLLSINHITSIINVSVEVENIYYEEIQYVRVPVADTPSSNLFDYFDPIADHIHGVAMRHGRTLIHCVAGVGRSAAFCIAYVMKYHSMSLLDAHIWTKSCRPAIHLRNSFWEQLIIYEYKLFSQNTVHMLSSSMGMIHDVYKEEAH
ncbi:PREDICTED: dual specificity protein phosphatase 18-like [Chrysochloris asiatica]|uniref:Dual specificity protein phosphatase 18-like n=1 Tax=Chrysochloris asiatica TaxID=185453 RepID=A0A9B0THU4_CHRAS|nr:PREDICTED: dual specificity protein phosphatase 18-like [Chrysochloris asiatica]